MTLQVKHQTAVRGRCTLSVNGVKVLVGSMNSVGNPLPPHLSDVTNNKCLQEERVHQYYHLRWQDVLLAFHRGDGLANVPACCFHFLLQCL